MKNLIKCNAMFIITGKNVNHEAAQVHIWQRHLFTLWRLRLTQEA